MRAQILELALAASGGAETERALLEPLCAAAELAWRKRLRKGVTLGECGEALACAAAFTAAANLAAGGGGAAASFSAGDISVQAPDGGERARTAENLHLAAEQLMEPYVQAKNLWVKGVKG